MTGHNITKRILVGLLVVTMTVTYIPTSAFAATRTVQDKPATVVTTNENDEQTKDAVNEAGSENTKETLKPETEKPSGSEKDAAGDDAVISEEAAGEDPGSKETAAFVREAESDGVIIKVETEPGVFPEDAELIAEKADKADEAKATEAIDEIRPDSLNVADSYTFDIKVVDADGNELQPAEDQKVNVTFNMARAADPNLSAEIYHLTEAEVSDPKSTNNEEEEPETVLVADKLDAVAGPEDATVTAQTDGFSLYTVEFTYGELQYVMNGGSEVNASVIMRAVGLEGEIEDIRVSREELFSASKESGEWIITSHKPFKTDEWMKVTINGVVYEIVVTDAEGDIEVNTWSGMQEAINNIQDGKTIVLTADLTAGSGDERFAVIREGVSFTIDLKGHTINRNLSSKNDNNKGHVFDVNKGTVTIRDSAGGGKLTGGSDENGGAIVIGGEGALNIEGVIISENRAKKEGGAIYVYGKLTMTGGKISDNTSDTGGAISVHKSGTVTLNNVDIQNNTASSDGGGIAVKGMLTMTGGAVSGNKAEDAAGVYNRGGTIKLTGVAISGNETSKYGGAGINNKGKATIEGCTIIGNKAKQTGGGIYADSDITITNCTFTNNHSDTCGGAVRMYDCTATITDCEMTGNTANEYGGAVYIDDDGKAVISGVKITGGTAYKGGSGIYVGSKGKLDLGGINTITGNTATDVYMTSGKKINITSALGNEAKKSQIGVVLKDREGVITSGYSQYNGDTDPYEFIIPEVGCSVALDKGEVQYLASRWGFIQHLIDAAENGDVINLDWDVKGKADDKSLTVPAGKVITINLNGHTLDRGLSSYKEDGEVFNVNGKLTIKDTKGGGKVTGGYGTGGGILVNNGGSFILEGGSIAKNKAKTNGGGILVLEGAFATIRTSGSDEAPIIKGNSAPKGAGIYSAGTLIIQKDTVIKDNDASESGGGLYIAGGSVELSGTITENSATNEAGGIWHGTNATLNVKGAPDVTGNTSAVANNIYLKDGSVITVTSLTDTSGKEAKLDVTANAGGAVLTSALTESGAQDKAAQVFTYNGAAFADTLVIKEDGELYNKEVTADDWVSDWKALQNKINSSQPGQVIGLESDVKAGSKDDCQFVEDGRNVIIELNGHVINRNLSDDEDDGNVFRIQDGSTLTIRDGVGTGVLTGGYPDGDGGAINIEDDSTFVLEGGTIKGNRSTRDGGAIYIDEGFLKMTGGTIADNKAGDEGGAIYCRDDGYFEIANAVFSSNKSEGGGGAIKAHLDRDSSIADSVIRDNRSDSTGGAVNLDQDKKTLAIENTIIKGNKAEEDAGGIYLQNGTIRMNGGELSDNSGEDAGGIMVTSDEKFFAEGVAITGNESKEESGGGVNNQGNTTLTGCTINNNEANEAGGGVYNKSKLSMTDCTLSENTSEEEGGAVFNKDDAALKNCTITKNKSNTEVGGGVCHSDNKMSIDGGRITENEGRSGNGIYVDDELSIQGALVVKDNEYQNVYLNDEKLKVTGSLEGSDIRVTMSKETGTFTKGYKNNNKDHESGAEIEPWYYFAADDESYSVLKDNDGEAKIAGSEWPQLQKLIDDTANSAEEGGETPILSLDRSWQAKKSDAALTIPAGKSIIIDLNGFTIDRNRESKSGSGQVFVVNSGNALTIKDSSEAKTGTITGGWAENGGAICLNVEANGGSAPILTIESGNITGNKADRGGAIYMAEAGNRENGAVVNINGGMISGNQANVEAGGIWAGKTGNLNVSGMPFVLGNNGGAGSNILLGEGNLIHITDTLTIGSGNNEGTIDTAALDLTAKSAEGAEGTGVKLTEGLTATTPQGSTAEDYAKAIFTYNETSYESTLEIKEGELYSKDVSADIWVSDWAGLQAAVDNGVDNEGKIIGLKRDIDASRDNYSIKVDGDKISNVTIELNGHKMDRKRSSSNDDGHVINVKDGATLTIRDGVGTGILTGGNSSDDGGGIKIEKNSKCVIEGGTISGNKAEPDGGGIFVKGTLVMTGGTISNNYADDTGGGIYCSDDGTFDLKNAKIYGNTSDNDGGGLIVHLKSDASIENCSILNNESKTEDGGGMRVEADEKTLTITNSLIGANRAENDGGGIVIYAGKVIMNGGAISNNTSEDGAGVYNDDGTIEFDSVIIDGNTSTDKGGAGINNRNNATLKNCVITNNTGKASGGGIYTNEPITVTGGMISGNSASGDGGGIFNTDDGTRLTGVEISGNSAKKDGGGIFTDEDMTLTNCTLDSNKSDVDGGGMRIKDCSVSLENCTIKDNDASEEGGGIYINNDDAELKLNGGTFTGNAARSGGGIYVNDGTDDVYIKGDIGIYDNIAYGDVYLAKGRKLTVTGPLAEGEGSTASSRIGIVTKDGFEKNFTKDYNKHNPGIDPATVFFSNENHIVYLKDGKEAALKKNNAVVDENPFIEVNSQMERRIGALNGANWMSGLSGERYLSEVNMPGTHDSGMNNVQGNVRTSRGSWISAGVFGGIGIVVGGIFGALMGGPAGFAIGALIVGTIAAGSGLTAGVDVMTGFARTQDRYIDEQLEDGIRKFDLRVNTCYVDLGFSQKDNGKDLWIIHGEDKMGGTFYALDDDDDRLTLAKVFEWYKKFLREHPTETILIGIDPQGIGLDKDEADERIEKHIRSLAQEINPSTGKPYLYTENGDYTNIKYTTWPQVKDCRGQIIYSLGKKTGLAAEYQVGGSYKDDANAKKKHLKEFYEQYGFDQLPTTGNNGNKYFDYYMSAGTNGTQQPTHTPLWVADQVLPTLFDKGGLLTDRQGKYIGLVNMDRETSKVSRQVWITNFFSGLEYRTVTAKASEDDDNPKTYTVLSETPIVIPDCIYEDPNSAGERFWYWKATDSDGNLVGNYYPGDPFTVMGDVTFTAVWEEPDLSSIRAVWVDGDDADGIRPKKLNVTVTKVKEEGEEGEPETEVITLTEDNKVWRKDLNYKAENVAVEEVPEGYTCIIKDTRITLSHTPEKKVHAAGTITWRDNENAGGQRPSSIELTLYEDGVMKKNITVSADDWTYDLGELPLYKYDEEKNKVTKINYSLTETGVPDEYSTYVSGLIENGSNQGFEITNTLNSSKEMLLGYIYWSDEENDGATRPDKVTLNLYANGEKITSQDIGAGSATTWLFDFIKDPAIPYSDYEITVDPIPGYNTTVNMGTEYTGAIIVATLESHKHEEQEATVVITEATCDEPGEQVTTRYCATCGAVFDVKTEKIEPLGHEWGKWNTRKTATEDEEGLEERVCSRDTSHVESRVVPKKTHVHKSVKVNAKAPTCTVEGNIAYYYCSECGWNYRDEAKPAETWFEHGDEVLPALGHDWDKWKVVKEATETEAGTEERVCKHDSAHKETRDIPPTAHEHQLSNVDAKKPTCTEDGNIEYWVCDGGDDPCGLYFSDSNGSTRIDQSETIIPATGHDWGEWETVAPATESEAGFEKRICKNEGCDATEEREIPETSHKHKPVFVPNVAPTCISEGNKAYYYCDECDWYFLSAAHPGTTWIAHGDEVLPIDPDAHSWGPWEETKAPTDTEEGEETHTCTRCGATESRAVPKVDPSKVSYRVTEGNDQTWYKGSDETADFTFKRSVDDKSTFSHFTGIKVDGKKVSTGNYTKESGSVIIKLKPKYLKNLKNGKHTLTAEFNDGSASAKFKVADKGSDASGSKNSGSSRGNGAATGDSSNILLWLIMITISAMIMSGMFISRMRRQQR